MYHADGKKEKCDLQGGRRQEFIEWEGQNQPEIELYGASVEQEVNWLGRGIHFSLPSPGFCQVVKRLPHDWQDPVEEFPSKATSVQDVTTLPGIIFAPKVIYYL